MIMKKCSIRKCFNWLKKNQNESLLDRLLRVLVAEILIILAYFWLGIVGLILAWIGVALLIFTAIIGYCCIYRLLGLKIYDKKKKPKLWQIVPLLLIIAFLPTIAGYCSVKHTSDRFMRDFDAMDIFMKQSVYDSHIVNRNLLVDDYVQWQKHFERFNDKYSHYRPFIVKYDSRFCDDLRETEAISSELNYLVRRGNLGQANLELKKIDDMWTEMKKRNRISVFDLAVVGFERVAKELVTASSKMDAPTILWLYPRADLKLREIEANSDTPETRALRQALENLLSGAREGRAQDIPGLGADLEDAFSVF